MKTKLHISKPIDPKKLSPAERDQLAEDLYQVHIQIFDGVDKAPFRNYVIEPDTVCTKLFLVHNRNQELVGYLTFQVYQAEIIRKGKVRKPYIFRTEMGILEAWRGGAPLSRYLFWEAVKFSIRNGLPECYYMATPIHPLPYYLVCRDVKEVYPQPGIATPEHIIQIKEELSRSLQLPAASPTNRFVKKVGWIVRQSPAQQRRTEKSDNAWFQYFLTENPGYTEGTGLLWLAPGTLKNGVLTAARIIKRQLKNPLRGIVRVLPRSLRPVLSR